MKWISIGIVLIAVAISASTFLLGQSSTMTPQQEQSVSKIKRTIPKLRSLHTKLGKPEAGQWLATHNEKGQTFSQYRKSKPNVLAGRRRKLYVQPIGDFTETDVELIAASAEFLSIYFNCEVVTNETLSESVIPESAQRTHPSWGVHQLLTSHILDEVLAPELPADAFATIAFTKSDLWPGKGWNFVFGYAAFRDRVGVWSLARFGDPEESEAAKKKCLLRTIKVATHETGHMFSIQHCIKYQCNMQGSNSLDESDEQPLYLCPQCHAKILYATGCEPVDRYKKLVEFCEKHELKDQKEYFQQAISRLQ